MNIFRDHRLLFTTAFIPDGGGGSGSAPPPNGESSSNTGDASQTNTNAGAGFTECIYTDEQIDELKSLKEQYETELFILKGQLSSKEDELDQKQAENIKRQKTLLAIADDCDHWKEQLTEAKDKLSDYVEGTLNYEKQRNVIAYFSGKTESCLRENNLNLTEYNTIFITSYCNTNEYEGDITIFGDPNWNSDIELLHACGSMGYICPTPNEAKFEINHREEDWWKSFYNSSSDNTFEIVNQNSDPITDKECCEKLQGNLINEAFPADTGDTRCITNVYITQTQNTRS